MSHITYESIRPLVAEVTQDKHLLGCVFGCPLSDFRIRSQAALVQRGLGSQLVEPSAAGPKVGLIGFFRRIFGATAEAIHDEPTDGPVVYSEGDKQRALVEAFHAVRDAFVWDGGAARWISARAGADLLPEFNQQLAAAPVTSEHDREVLARMLVEIAQVDGRLADEERAFFDKMIGDAGGGVDALAKRPALNADALSSCGALAVRETMLMLAWATSLVDGELHAKEAARIEELARGLCVRDGRSDELKRYAQIYLVDQALERAHEAQTDRAKHHAEAFALAQRLGLDRATVERVDVRLRKRLGRL